MRPVNKGSSPYKTISKYADALPFLEKTLGLYCSYCEFPIAHLPEVEHVSAKSKGGDLTNWDNLLLGCKYCNTRKGDKVTPDNRSDYLWPDEDNTVQIEHFLIMTITQSRFNFTYSELIATETCHLWRSALSDI